MGAQLCSGGGPTHSGLRPLLLTPALACRPCPQGKRGLEKPPFKLPEFIEATGIGERGRGHRFEGASARSRGA